jgi:hypothetical protein
MKKFTSSLAAGLATMGVLVAMGTLAFVPTDAAARGHSAGAGGRSNASGVRSHSFHRGTRVGVFVGAPIVAAYPYYYGYGGPYYYPPAVYVQEQPMVYIEPPASAPQAQLEQYWYYCQDSKTYYPYVQNCAAPWQRVIPHAPQ